jgi:hypothetical protein
MSRQKTQAPEGGTTKSPPRTGGWGRPGSLAAAFHSSLGRIVVLWRRCYAPTTEHKVRCSDWRCGGSVRRGRSRSHTTTPSVTGRASGAGRQAGCIPNRHTPVSFLLSQLKENAGPHLVPTRQSYLICRKWPGTTSVEVHFGGGNQQERRNRTGLN